MVRVVPSAAFSRRSRRWVKQVRWRATRSVGSDRYAWASINELDRQLKLSEAVMRTKVLRAEEAFAQVAAEAKRAEEKAARKAANPGKATAPAAAVAAAAEAPKAEAPKAEKPAKAEKDA